MTRPCNAKEFEEDLEVPEINRLLQDAEVANGSISLHVFMAVTGKREERLWMVAKQDLCDG